MDQPETSENPEKREQIGNQQFYDLVTSKEASWQAIIYDLINTEQLDPWDINLALLSNKYLEKIQQLEEGNFFISSKVLLAASLLLKLKSEILLHQHIKSIDEILFGKKEESKPLERIEIDESELPLLTPKTPLPRDRKVTLQELMTALDKALSTETRRIKKETSRIQQEKLTDIVLPKRKISVKDRIRKIYSRVLTSFKKKQTKISYTDLTGNNLEEKRACFLPILHLDNQHRLFLDQDNHLSEIYIWLYKHYKTKYPEKFEELESESDITGFDNPLANFFDTQSEIIKGNLE